MKARINRFSVELSAERLNLSAVNGWVGRFLYEAAKALRKETRSEGF